MAPKAVLVGLPGSGKSTIGRRLAKALDVTMLDTDVAIEQQTGRRIADNAPIAVRQAKHSIQFGMQMDLASAMMFEIEAYNRMVPTADRREGVLAFNEKRKPRFIGR